MGFDPQNEDQPLVDVGKRTTKVNVGVVVGVVVFLLIAAIVMFIFVRSPAETRNEMHEENVEP
jgi:large-conductance mechanosensitive channel